MFASASTSLAQVHPCGMSRPQGEKSRWSEVTRRLARDYVNLTGDVLLAVGFIAYLGPYTAPYRDRMAHAWLDKCR